MMSSIVRPSKDLMLTLNMDPVLGNKVVCIWPILKNLQRLYRHWTWTSIPASSSGDREHRSLVLAS